MLNCSTSATSMSNNNNKRQRRFEKNATKKKNKRAKKKHSSVDTTPVNTVLDPSTTITLTKLPFVFDPQATITITKHLFVFLHTCNIRSNNTFIYIHHEESLEQKQFIEFIESMENLIEGDDHMTNIIWTSIYQLIRYGCAEDDSSCDNVKLEIRLNMLKGWKNAFCRFLYGDFVPSDVFDPEHSHYDQPVKIHWIHFDLLY